MKFKLLVKAILDTQQHLQQKALQSVNQWLSIRNWLFGYYIVEYQQKGEDRAKYGDQLIRNLSIELKAQGVKGMSFTNLNLYRQFYHEYPQIVQTVSEQLKNADFSLPKDFLLQKPSMSKNIQTVPEQLQRKIFANTLDSKILIRHFSFSHFIELIKIGNRVKRAFYEIEAIKGNWSVRQLKR